MHTCRPQRAALRTVLFLPFCPSFSWLGKTDSGANKVSVGVCEAYVEIPGISKNRYSLHYEKEGSGFAGAAVRRSEAFFFDG